MTYVDIFLLSNLQNSSEATPAFHNIWYLSSLRGIKQPGRQFDASFSPTSLHGVDRGNFSLYRETNAVNGHKLTGLRSTARSCPMVMSTTECPRFLHEQWTYNHLTSRKNYNCMLLQKSRLQDFVWMIKVPFLRNMGQENIKFANIFRNLHTYPSLLSSSFVFLHPKHSISKSFTSALISLYFSARCGLFSGLYRIRAHLILRRTAVPWHFSALVFCWCCEWKLCSHKNLHSIRPFLIWSALVGIAHIVPVLWTHSWTPVRTQSWERSLLAYVIVSPLVKSLRSPFSPRRRSPLLLYPQTKTYLLTYLLHGAESFLRS